jgi:hypothetical protein
LKLPSSDNDERDELLIWMLKSGAFEIPGNL